MRFWRIFSLRVRTNQTEPSMSIDLQQALQRTIEHREIFHDEMLALMRKIMSGEASPVMVAALTVGLRVKKETIGEIAAAAQVMREFSTKVELADHEHLVDIVGTGGDASHTFNISTAAMFVTAAGRCHRDRAAPTCWRRSAPTSCLAPRRLPPASARPASVSCSRPTTTAR